MVALALIVLYPLPAAAAIAGVGSGQRAWVGAGLAGYGLGVAGRITAARATGGRIGRGWPDSLAHPISMLLFGWLVLVSVVGHHRHTLTWKGRPV